MAVNLVSLASQHLTPDLMDRISSSLGADRKNIGQATSAAVPALLGSMASMASSRDGAQKLDAAVSQQSPSLLDNLGSTITGGEHKGLVDSGIRHLTSLFGGSSVSALSNAVGRFSGIGQSTATSLIGILAPMLLAVLHRQKEEKGLDATGLASLLSAQRDNISAAMPSGFKTLLQSADMPNIAGVSKQTVRTPERPAAAETHRMAAATAQTATAPTTTPRTPEKERGGGSWWLWALPLLALLGLALWFFNSRTVEQTGTTSTVVGGVDLGSTLRTTISDVTTTLRGITDETSARSALPKLQAAEAKLDGIIDLSNRLPDEGQRELSGIVSNSMPTIQRLSEQALANPGAASVVRTEVENVRGKLNELQAP